MQLLAAIIGYLMGSFPSGYLAGKYIQGIDIRQHGSGNIGFTNVLRVLGPFPAVLVLIADVGKGALSTYIGFVMGQELGAVLAAGASLAGHSWPLYIGFRGGKMIATGLGVLFGLDWRVALVGAGIWLAVLAVTRYVSLSSIIAVASVPLTMIFLKSPLEYVVLGIIAAGIAIYKHRDNIKRLRQGTEYKIGQKPC